MESKEQDRENSHASKMLELMSALHGREALPHLSLSSVCYAFNTHYLLGMLIVLVMIMEDVGDDNGG